MRRGMRKMLNPVVAPSTETAALSIGCDPDLCALVCCLSAEPATSGRDDVRTRNLGRSFDGASLGMKLLPVLEKVFLFRKRSVGKSWRMDETYIKVRDSGSIYIVLWTRMAAQLTFCFALDATGTQHSAISTIDGPQWRARDSYDRSERGQSGRS